MKRLLDSEYRRALDLLRQNRELLEESAAQLLEAETLDEEQLSAIFERIHRTGFQRGPIESPSNVEDRPAD